MSYKVKNRNLFNTANVGQISCSKGIWLILFLVGLVFPLLFFLTGCEPAETQTEVRSEYRDELPASRRKHRPPNIVLVTICSGRYQQMGFSGYSRPTTPFIDSLADRGVSFSNAVASSSWTKPTTATILTGLTPNVHRMTDYYEIGDIRSEDFEPKRTLSNDIVTIAECLKEVGYATFYRNNNIHASQFFNMDQGFDDAPLLRSNVETPKMLDDFNQWVKSIDDDQPFFFFMLTRDTHLPYMPDYEYYRKFSRDQKPIPADRYEQVAVAIRVAMARAEKSDLDIPERFRQAFIDLYDGELAQLDNSLRRLPEILEENGKLSNTLIVVTADHGERLFDAHGVLGHSRSFMEEAVLHVPLIFFGKSVPSGMNVDDVVRTIDIYPTLAEIAGANPPDIIQGRSLTPYFSGKPMEPVNAFGSYGEDAHVVRWDKYKLHRTGENEISQLFDIEKDPDEVSNVRDKYPEITGYLESELEKWLDMEAKLRELVSTGETRELTPEVIENLRSLGYIQ